MLNKPTLKELMPNVDSKYALVIIASKRARTVIQENPEMLSTTTISPVSIALRDIAEGKITWTAPNSSTLNPPD